MSDFSLFDVDGTIVLWWHRKMTLAGVQEFTRRGDQMVKSKKLAFLTMIDPESDLNAPADARRLMADFLARNDAKIAAAAIVYEATGFKATALRSVITAINLASRSSFPNKVFSDLTQGIRWLGVQAHTPPAATERLIRTTQERRQNLAS